MRKFLFDIEREKKGFERNKRIKIIREKDNKIDWLRNAVDRVVKKDRKNTTDVR